MLTLLLACTGDPAAEPAHVDGALSRPNTLDLRALALAAIDSSGTSTLDRIGHVHDLLASVEAPGMDDLFPYYSHLLLWGDSVSDVSGTLEGLEHTDGAWTSVVNNVTAELVGEASAWELRITPPDAAGWVDTSATRDGDVWTIDFLDPMGSGELKLQVVQGPTHAEMDFVFDGTRLVSDTEEPQSGSFEDVGGHQFDFELATDGSGWMQAFCPDDGAVSFEATFTGASGGEACVYETACCEEDCSADCLSF